MSQVLEQYLTLAEAAAALEICVQTFQKRVRAGEIQPYRDNRDRRVVLYRADDVDRLKRPTKKGEL